MRIVTISTGVILVGTGIWCFAHPGSTFLSLAFMPGIAMLISGLSNIASFLVYKGQPDLSAWQLADGILSTVLAVMLLSNLLITDAMVISFFGMWILFSGVLRIVASFVLKRHKIPGWYAGLIAGALSLLAGVYAFANPLVAGLTMVIIIGGVSILQGANIIIMGVQMKKA